MENWWIMHHNLVRVSDSDWWNETGNTRLVSFFSFAFILVLITIIMVYEICLELIFSGDQNPPPIPKFW